MDIFKENFPKNVINDLYKLCFQNYRASIVNIYYIKKNKLHRSLLGVRGRGGGISPLNSPLSNI